MKGQMHIIKPDATVDQIERRDLTAPPGLDALQSVVEGYIEMVPLMLNFVTPDGLKPCVVYCNEDGRHMDLPPNKTANEMWAESDPMLAAYPLVGTVVVLTGDQAFMDAL